MSETINDTKNKLIALLTKSLPSSNISVEELIKRGNEEIESILENRKQNRENYFNVTLRNRQETDYRSSSAYFTKYLKRENDEHGDVYWFAKALKELGNLGALLIGATSIKDNQDGNNFNNERNKLAISEQINAMQLDELELFDFDTLKQVGSEFQDQLPEGVRDKLYETFDYQAGVRIMGLIVLKEVRVLFDTFEKRAKELQAADFARSGICFRKPVVDKDVNVNDLLLLSDFYVRIYNGMAKNLPERTEEETSNLKNDMFQKLARVPWSGYMEIFRTSLKDGRFESIIPTDVKSQAYVADREKIKDEYRRCETIEQKEAFFRKYCVECYGGRIPGQNSISGFIWDTNDHLVLDERFTNDPKEALSYAISKVYKEIGKVYGDYISAPQKEDASQTRVFSITPSITDKSKFYRSILSVETLWQEVRKQKARLGYVEPTKEMSLIEFSQGTTYQDAVYITLAQFFAVDPGVVGKYTYKDKTLIIRPDRFLRRKAGERSIDAISFDVLRREQEEENKGVGHILQQPEQ